MIVDNLSQLLGTKNNKYERNKLLEQWREEYPTTEIIKNNTEYFIVIPDEVLDMFDLLDSQLVSESQKRVISQSIEGTGEFKSVHREKIIENFGQYYEFVNFSNGRGGNRKLLLGSKKTVPEFKSDKREVGNKSLPYASEGADLLSRLIRTICDGTYEVPSSNIYIDEFSNRGVYFTKFQWYERAFMNTTAFSNECIPTRFSNIQFTENEWKSIVKRYKKKKKEFYISRFNSFVTRLSKTSTIEFEDRLIGAYPDSEENRWDEANLLDKPTQEDILNYENLLLKKYSLTHFEAYYTKKSEANKFNSDYYTYINEKFSLTKTWRVLAVDFNNISGIDELSDEYNKKNSDFDEVKKSLIEAIEEDWKDYLNKYIEKEKRNFNRNVKVPTTNFHFPWGFYNIILEGYIYFYLDEYFEFRKFPADDRHRYLEEHFEPVNNTYSLGDDILELIELGVMHEEDVQRQLDLQDEDYVAGMKSYRLLSVLRNRFVTNES